MNSKSNPCRSLYLRSFLLTDVAETPEERWSLIRRRLYPSKVQRETTAKLGLGYNPLKDSPVCYTKLCQRKHFALPIFKLESSISTEQTCTTKLTPEKVNIETQIINTLHDLKQSTMRAVDFSTGSTFNRKYVDTSFSYAHSREIHSVVDMIMKNNVTLILTAVNVTSMYLAIAKTKLELSDEFRFVIKNLPCCDLNETEEEYIREFFIGYFGYTYIKDVQLGGIVQQTIAMTENDRTRLEQNGFNTSNESWLKDAAKEIFLGQTKLDQTDTRNKTLMKTLSKYFAKSNPMVFGGTTSIRSLKNWPKSVAYNPVVVKIGLASIFDLLTTHYFPDDSSIDQKAKLIKSVVDQYLSNSAYCHHQCTDSAHGTCVDSGYFQFGVCKCRSGWRGVDCATPVRMYFFLSTVGSFFSLYPICLVDHYIDILHNNVFPIWNSRARRNSYSISIGYGKGQMPPNETVSNILDHSIHTKYSSFGSGSADGISLTSGLNTGFYLTLNAVVCIVTGFQFTTAMSQPNRDPMRITLEGSNTNHSLLTFGASWTLIYNGSSGIEIDPGRGKTGSRQSLNNSRPYRSYRILVVSKRGIESGVHYAEFAFYGHSCLPGQSLHSEEFPTIELSIYFSA